MSFFQKILDQILGGNTLYYPGCLTKTMLPEIEQNYEKILRNLGIDFIKLSDSEFCCGSPVLRAGLQTDFEEIKVQNIQLFRDHGVKLIITNCPACYNIFKYHYLLDEHQIKVEHITQTLFRKKAKLKSLNKWQKITYHDPCHLGRHSQVYDEPRQVLKCLGYLVQELPKNKKFSTCCGGGGWLINNNPELSQKIAQKTLTQVSKGKLVSPCPMCYYQFKKNSDNQEVVELSELI